jgi:hypothetical protein
MERPEILLQKPTAGLIAKSSCTPGFLAWGAKWTFNLDIAFCCNAERRVRDLIFGKEQL